MNGQSFLFRIQLINFIQTFGRIAAVSAHIVQNSFGFIFFWVKHVITFDAKQDPNRLWSIGLHRCDRLAIGGSSSRHSRIFLMQKNYCPDPVTLIQTVLNFLIGKFRYLTTQLIENIQSMFSKTVNTFSF